MISNATLEYLKTIYILKKQKNEIRVTDIAESLNHSKASVTKQLQILSKNNLINYETYGKIELTKEGIKVSKELLQATDIVYILLNNIIGIKSDIAFTDSNNIKSVISKESLNKISEYINKTLELNEKCNFDINKESCRECIKNRKDKLV